MAGGMHDMHTPLGKLLWLRHMVNERAVCIQLECILVEIFGHFGTTQNLCVSYLTRSKCSALTHRVNLSKSESCNPLLKTESESLMW